MKEVFESQDAGRREAERHIDIELATQLISSRFHEFLLAQRRQGFSTYEIAYGLVEGNYRFLRGIRSLASWKQCLLHSERASNDRPSSSSNPLERSSL